MELESPRSPQSHSPEPQQQQVIRAQITPKSLDHSRANNAAPVGNEGTGEDIDSPPYSPRLDELPDSPVTDITPAAAAELSVAGNATQSALVTPSLLLQQLTLHHDSQAPPLLSPLSPPSPLVIPPAVSPLQTLLVPCANCSVLWPMFVNATRPDGRNYWYAHSDISCLDPS